MKELLLLKYGEIVLKGANRRYFEDTLVREVRFRASTFGKFNVTRSQSILYVEPQDDTADMDGLFSAVQRLFGVVAVDRAVECDAKPHVFAHGRGGGQARDIDAAVAGLADGVAPERGRS